MRNSYSYKSTKLFFGFHLSTANAKDHSIPGAVWKFKKKILSPKHLKVTLWPKREGRSKRCNAECFPKKIMFLHCCLEAARI